MRPVLANPTRKKSAIGVKDRAILFAQNIILYVSIHYYLRNQTIPGARRHNHAGRSSSCTQAKEDSIRLLLALPLYRHLAVVFFPIRNYFDPNPDDSTLMGIRSYGRTRNRLKPRRPAADMNRRSIDSDPLG